MSALPAGTVLFIVADHGHTLIHREFYPNVWLREQGLLALKAEKPKGLADVDPATKVFTLDPGRIYVHRQGRFPLGSVGSTEADDLLGRVREGLLALRDDRPGRAGDGRPVPRIFARDEIYRGPCVESAPDLVLDFADGYDPKGAFGRTELFGRSALTGMHTYADALFFMNRRDVPTDGLDIIDVGPTVLAAANTSSMSSSRSVRSTRSHRLGPVNPRRWSSPRIRATYMQKASRRIS